jgi:hypothetical protein
MKTVLMWLTPAREADIQARLEKIRKQLKEKRERQKERHKIRRRTDINFRLRQVLRHRIRHAITNQGTSKARKSEQLLGCSIAEVRVWIERQFAPGMSWSNHSVRGWHIDHKVPCSSFDLTEPEQQQACFHFTNLQPLWAVDNLRKGASMEPDETQSILRKFSSLRKRLANIETAP